MSLIGNKRTSSETTNLNSDERAAASDFATIIRADEGSTVNFGLGGDQLQSLLGFRDADPRADQRAALQSSLAGNDGGGFGGNGLLIVGGVLVLVLLMRP